MSKILGSAKVNEKGGFTIPVNIRKKKNIKNGDVIVFIEEADGSILLKRNKPGYAEL